MAKVGGANKLSNEEIESMVDEFAKKLEILRVRYEQYFIGVEKTAPAVMRMDVVRLMRTLEQMQVKNTALKFKIRQNIQKFTSYSTYWNRTLREIEDGRYKRHVDKAKRTVGTETPKPAVAEVAHAEKTQAVADEAEAFLASLGLGGGRPQEKAAPEPAVKSTAPVVSESLSASDVRGGGSAAETRNILRSRRPSIVHSGVKPAIVQPAVQASSAAPAVSIENRPPSVARSDVRSAAVSGARPAIVQSASRPAIVQSASRPAVVQPAAAQPQVRPAVNSAMTPPAAAQPPVMQPPAARPAVPQRPAVPPRVPPAAAQPPVPPTPGMQNQARPPLPPRPGGMPSMNAPKAPGMPGLPPCPRPK